MVQTPTTREWDHVISQGGGYVTKLVINHFIKAKPGYNEYCQSTSYDIHRTTLWIGQYDTVSYDINIRVSKYHSNVCSSPVDR